MRNKIAFITCILCILLLTECKKNDIIYNTYFYSVNAPTDGELSLYINGQYKGALPHLSQKPTCDNDSLKNLALFMRLESGKYKLEAIEQSGNVKSSNTIKFKKNSMSSSGGIGGQESTAVGDCMTVGLYY